MAPGLTRRLQVFLLAALVLAGVRLAYVIHERSQPGKQAEQKTPALDPDDYVSPHRLNDYDLKSLKRDLAGHAAWVREGYRFSYYPFDARSQHADFSHEAGTLGPIERLDISDVVLDRAPHSGRQIMAVFSKAGKPYALPVGAVTANGDSKIVASEILFIQDPHELYRHWPAEAWQAVERHEVKKGMNEIQASFAVGMGIPEPQREPEVKVVHYPNGGKALTVTYRNGHAVEITGAGL